MDYPKVVVFDLDYTLWPCWCDTHISMPLKSVSKTKVVDKYGKHLSLFRDVESIILELKQNGVTIVGASRTATPRVAQELLTLLHVGEKPALTYFDSLQWGQGSKVRHIKNAVSQLGLHEELSEGEFILFDDELRNKDVESVNCHFAHIEDEWNGLTREVFVREIQQWRTKMDKSRASSEAGLDFW